jgi:hypothetical protein
MPMNFAVRRMYIARSTRDNKLSQYPFDCKNLKYVYTAEVSQVNVFPQVLEESRLGGAAVRSPVQNQVLPR